jgi:hypothetical protein
MTKINNSHVIAFGKLFVKKAKTIPALPDMKLLVLKTDDGFQAVCIDLEIDSVGETIKIACNNLTKALTVYTQMMIDNFGNIEDAVRDIVKVSYSSGGRQKKELFDLYLESKYDYIMKRIAEKKEASSRTEEVKEIIFRLFQLEPIDYKLQTA